MSARTALAGQSLKAQALLAAAEDGITAGADLDRLLLANANLAALARSTEGYLLFSFLEDACERRRKWEAGLLPGWTADEVDAEVLGHLFPLVSGLTPCSCPFPGGLNGRFDDLDSLHAASNCPAKRRAVA